MMLMKYLGKEHCNVAEIMHFLLKLLTVYIPFAAMQVNYP